MKTTTKRRYVMKRTKILRNIMLAVFAALFFVLISGAIMVKPYSAYAQTEEEANQTTDAGEEGTPSERLFTQLSISINCGDGKVWATAKNDFTLFPSTVVVIVQLYSSDTYAESYEQMTLVSANSTSDLDMGNTITTEASTGGVEKFWLARMRYKIDNGSWEYRQTAACRISGSGEFLGYV